MEQNLFVIDCLVSSKSQHSIGTTYVFSSIEQ